MKKTLSIALALTMTATLFVGVQVSMADEQQPVSIIFADANNENTATAQSLAAMLDYIEEKTNGAVTFQRFFGASVCAAAEEYDYLKDGSIQMAAPKPADFASVNPYVYGVTCNTNWDDLYNYYQEVFFNNEESAPIIQQSVADDGLHLVGALISGQGMVMGKKEFSSVDDLVGQKMGVVMSGDYWEARGVSVVNTSPMDMYESLSRGVYDYAGFALSYYLPMSFQEVAPYVMNANEYQTSITVLVRDDVWSQLTDETKQIFQDAYKMVWDQCVADADATAEAVKAACEEAGGSYWVLPIEDAQDASAFMERTNSAMLITNAANLDGDEGAANMTKIIEVKAEVTGMDIMPEE